MAAGPRAVPVSRFPQGLSSVSEFEVPEPILNSPFEEPREHWRIRRARRPLRAPGRRLAAYFYRPPGGDGRRGPERPGNADRAASSSTSSASAWRPGAARRSVPGRRPARRWSSCAYWRREGRRARGCSSPSSRRPRPIIFLDRGARGLPAGHRDPARRAERASRKAEGYTRLPALRLQDGHGRGQDDGHGDARGVEHPEQGRTTARDARFSDVVLVVCPNVTIRSRLARAGPARGRGEPLPDARPRAAAPDAAIWPAGRVLVTNWHVFEPQTMQAGGVSAKRR